MSRLKLAIDIDDVLANSTDALRLFVNLKRGVNLREEHYKIEAEYWGYYESVWEQHGIDKKDLMREFHSRLVKSQSDIRTIPGSVEGTKKLSQKYDLIPMTSRPEEMKAETENWLKEEFGPVFTERPVFIGFGFNAKRTKGEVCKELGITYLIDDNVDHCKTALERGVGAVLFGDYGWNRRMPEGLVRCKNWQEVLEYFENEKSR
jgi:5'(3')-deoxyribonucleotidase